MPVYFSEKYTGIKWNDIYYIILFYASILFRKIIKQTHTYIYFLYLSRGFFSTGWMKYWHLRNSYNGKLSGRVGSFTVKTKFNDYRYEGGKEILGSLFRWGEADSWALFRWSNLFLGGKIPIFFVIFLCYIFFILLTKIFVSSE